MIHLPTDFLDLLRLLNEEKVDHIIIGGYAVIYHGYPRTTKDIDIWISPDEASQAVVGEPVGPHPRTQGEGL